MVAHSPTSPTSPADDAAPLQRGPARMEGEKPRNRAVQKLSLVLFVAMHLALALVLLYPPTWSLVLLAAGSYVLRMWAITVGYHRYLAHRSFRTSRAFQFILALLGTTAMQNGPLWWVSWHRRHHKHADSPEDPHSPVIRGFWHAHIGWVFDGGHDEPLLSNVKDLARFPELRFLDACKWLPLVAYAIGCYAIAGLGGVVWGFVVSTIALDHATFLVNSLAHLRGSVRHLMSARARNNPFIAILTLGEGWHNNHHRYETSARHGFVWWEIDLSYWTIKLLACLRLVWDVREPPASALVGSGRTGVHALGRASRRRDGCRKHPA
jgi:stearoyl-CoA desaturase (delta-9 desaturase)